MMKRQISKRERYEKLSVACEPFRRAKSETIRTLAGIGRRYRLLRYPIWIVLVAYIFIYNVILYGCIQLKVREKIARGVALVMTFALVFTSVDVTVFATAEDDGGDTGIQGVITAFADMDESVAMQSLPVGAEESEILFPEILTVTVEIKGGEEQTGDAASEEGADTEGDTGTEEGTEPREDAGTGEDAGTEEGTEPGEDAGTGEGTEPGEETGTGEGTGSGEDAGTGEGTGSGEDAGTGEGTEPGEETGTGEGTESGEDAGTGEGTGSGEDAGTEEGTGLGEESGLEESAAPEGSTSQESVSEGQENIVSSVLDFVLPQPMTVYAAEADGIENPAQETESLAGETENPAEETEASIAVTWEISGADVFDSSRAGNRYVYMPVIPEGYTVEESTALPQIVVTIEDNAGEKLARLLSLLEKLPDPLTYLSSGEPDESIIDRGQLDEARGALDEWLVDNGADDVENSGAVSGEDRERLSELTGRLEGLEHIRDTETDCLDTECPYHYPEIIQQRMGENETPQLLTLEDLVEEYGVEMPANAPIAVQAFAVQAFAVPTAATHPQTLMVTDDNENNSHTGTADDDIDVSMRASGSAHPIEIAFTLDELPTQSAYLAIKAYDVDEDDGETDYVYLNDDIYLSMDKTNSYGKKYNEETIGYLAGTNNTWNTTVLEIPLDKLKKGKNVISVTIAASWMVRVDWMQLILDGGAPDPDIEEFSLELQDAVTENGQVTVQSHVTVRQKGNTQYTTEYTLTQTETGNALDACFGQVQETEEIALGMPLNSPSGIYKITGMLKNPETEAIKATDSVSFYFIQGIGVGPKISHTLSPDVLTNQDVTITINAESMPGMGVTDVTVSPETMTVSKNCTSDFTIGYKLNGSDRSFSYWVKVNNIDKIAPKITYTPVTVLEDEAQETVKKLFADALSASDNRKLADEPWSYTIPTDVSSKPGTRTVRVTATDAAGNTSTKDCTITVTAKPLELKLGTFTAVSGSKDKYNLKAVLTHTGADEIKETGFVWGIMPSPTMEMNNGSAKTSPAVITKNGNISATATGLISGVEYYARAYAKVTASDGSEKVIYSEAGKFGFGIPVCGKFSVSTVSNSGKTTTFTIKRSGGSDGQQTVYYRTVNGSAIGGTHFTHTQGSLTFKDGDTSKTVKVTESEVTSAYKSDEGTRYSNADRTYSLEIYRVEGGGQIDTANRSKMRTMTKNSNYAIDRTIYTTEKSITHVQATTGENGKRIADTDDSQGGTRKNVSFLTNRFKEKNYHTSSSLSDYYSSYQQKYLNATAGGWYYRYVLMAYEKEDGYEHAYMGTSPLDDKNYGISDYGAAVSGVNDQLWACNFLQGEKSAVGTYSFPDERKGGGENSHYPLDRSGTIYKYDGKEWVKLGVDQTCYAYFGSTGANSDIWFVDGLTSYVMVQDETEPVLLGVAPMADGTYLPGDPITVALIFDEIVDKTNSSLSSSLTISTNVGTLKYAGGADTNVLYFTGTVSSSVNLSGSSALKVTGISNASNIKDMCSLAGGTSQSFTGSTNVKVDATKPSVTITADTSGSLPCHQATITATGAQTIQYTWTNSNAMPSYGWQSTTSGKQLTESKGTAGKMETWYLHVLATAASGASTHTYQSFSFKQPTITAVSVRAGSTTSYADVADAWKTSKHIVVQYAGAQSDSKITFDGPVSDSKTVASSGNGTTSLQVTKNGTYTVTLTDNYGSVISKTIEVQKIDTQKPTATIRSGSSTEADTVYNKLTLAVFPEDTGGSGVAKVEYAWTNNTTAPSPWTTLTAGTDGSYQAAYTATETAKTAKYLQVKVTDNAGNVSTVVWSGPYYMMKPATGAGLPSITVTGNPASWEKSAALNWTAKKGTGTGAGEIASVYTPDGSQTGDFLSGVTSGTCTVTKNGVYVFIVTDQYGNSAKTEVLVTEIDNEAPKLEKLDCSVSTNRETGTIKLTGATDDCTAIYDTKGNCTSYGGSGIQTREYRGENETEWKTFTGDSFTVTENGRYVVRLEDKLGNISKEYSVAMTLIKDKQAPSLTAAVESGVSANAGGWYNAAALHITLTYSDDVGTTKLYGKVDDGGFEEISGISTAPGTTFTKDYDCTEGVHTYTFKAEDAAGNATTSDQVTVKWDKTKPVIGEITFEQKAANVFEWIIGRQSLILCIPVTENGSGAEEISYTITPESGTAEDKTAKLEKGVAKITFSADWKGKITDIKCTDAAGNVSDTKSISGAANGFIVEDNPPVITFREADMTKPADPKPGVALSENYYEENAAPTVYVSVTDAEEAGITAGIASITYTINSDAKQTVNGSFGTDLKGSYGFIIPLTGRTGSVNITVKASDYAGNTAEGNVTVLIKGKEEKPNPTIDYRQEQITGLTPGAAYEVNGEILSADEQGHIDIREDWFGNTIRIIKKGTEGTSDSDAAELAIAGRPGIPFVSTENETIKGKKDGALNGVSADMEYSTDGGTSWMPFDPGKITNGRLSGLAPEKRLIRVKATDTTPHGEHVQITIAEGRTLTVTFDANGGSAVTAVTGKVWNETVDRPENPVKEGYTLEGWYCDNTLTTAWHFAGENDADQLTGDVTLYAKWKDTAKPNLTAALADQKDAGKWHRELAIELTYSDNEGVTELSVQKDGGAYTTLPMTGSTTQAGGKTYQLTFDELEEGEHTYTFKAVDAAGNETKTAALTAKLDTVNPQLGNVSFNEGYQNLWNWLIRKDSLEITVPITEAGSGIENVSYTLIPETGGSGTTGHATVQKASGGNSADYTATIYVTPDFKGRIRIAATDKAGNASDTKTIGTDGSGIQGVIVEDNAPEITFSVNGGEVQKEYKEVPTVDVTVKDDRGNAVSAGLASVTYQIGNEAENALQEDFTTSLKTEASFSILKEMIPADGGVIIVRATDNAGNQSEKRLTIRIYTGGGTVVKPTEPPKPSDGDDEPEQPAEPSEDQVETTPEGKKQEKEEVKIVPAVTDSGKKVTSDELSVNDSGMRTTSDEPAAPDNDKRTTSDEPAAPDNDKTMTSGEPTATDNGKGMTDTGKALKLGDGTVTVTVVCDEQRYTAEVADTMAAANAVLTPEQIQSVTDGENIEIRIDVKDISGNVSGQDKSLIENGIEEYRNDMPGLTLGMYIDISVFIKIGKGDWNAVNQTHEPVEVVIGIPPELQSDDRIFYIIRAHEGKYTLLEDMDEEPDTITICTDMFSTYAIAYEQADGTGDNPKCRLCHICPTFLGICYFEWLLIIMIVVLIIWFDIRKKRKEQETQKEL